MRSLYKWLTSSLRIQMIGFVVISLLVSIFATYSFFWLGIGVTEKNRYYYPSPEEVHRELLLANELDLLPATSADHVDESKREELYKFSEKYSLSLALTDAQGRVLLRVGDMPTEQVDLHSFLRRVETQLVEPSDRPEKRKIAAVYPLAANGEKYYLFGVKSAEGRAEAYRLGDPYVSVVAAVSAFLFTYLWLTRGKLNQIRELARGMDRFTKGIYPFGWKRKGRTNWLHSLPISTEWLNAWNLLGNGNGHGNKTASN